MLAAARQIGDRLGPFERVAAEAKAIDENAEGGEPKPAAEAIGRGKATVKWARYNRESGLLGMMLEDWCKAFGRSDLLDEWDRERNGDLAPADVLRAIIWKVWWRGGCGHSWQAEVPNRLLAADLNGGLAPDDVCAHARRKVWWRGECGHVWEQRVDQMADLKGEKCPFCANRRVLPGFNDLATVRPDIAGQWHPTMNRHLKPGEVITTSSKEVWWKGECGHTWKAKVRDRTRAKSPSCPYCSGCRRPERPIRLD